MDKFTIAAQKSPSSVIVDMGDRISAKNAESDLYFTHQVKKHFNQIAKPVYHLWGNHDVAFMDQRAAEEAVGQSSQSFSVDEGDYHLVFWNPNVDLSKKEKDGKRGIMAAQEHLDWLADDLSKTDKPTIIFSHFPLDGQSLDRLPDNSPGRCFGYLNNEAIRTILERSGKVLLCLSGHNHEDRSTSMNDIHYITIQSLTEAVRGRPKKPHGRYAELEINADSITLTLKSLSGQKRRVLAFKPAYPQTKAPYSP